MCKNVDKYLILIIIFSEILCLTTITPICLGNDISEMPPGVVITLNKASRLVDSDKTLEAIEVLRRFQNIQQNFDPVTAQKRGYTHYYIDFTLGNYYLMLSKLEKAVAHFQTAVSKNKNYSDAWINLAKCYYDLNQPGHAAESFHNGYQTQEQKNAKYLYYSAVCYTSVEAKWWKALAHLYFQKDQYKNVLVALLVYSFINPL